MAKDNVKGRIHKSRPHRRTNKTRRFEVVFNPDYGTDHRAIDYLDNLAHGTKSDWARDAILEKISRDTELQKQQVADERLVSDLREQVRELQEENTELRLGGNVPFEEKPTTVIDEERHAALSGKLKKLKMGFAGL